MSKLWAWIKRQFRDDDWWDLMGDPFLSVEMKMSLPSSFPEKFPCNWDDPRLPDALASIGVLDD